jgi:cytochrome P450
VVTPAGGSPVDAGPVAYRPFDPASHLDPYPAYRRLRDEDPVHRTAAGYWVLSRFADVFDAASDGATFSSAQGLTFEQDEIAALGLKPTLVMMDRPRHTTFRRLISRGFTPRSVAGLEPAVREFARARLVELAESGGGDFCAAVAGPLPTFVVATYLGVPESDRGQFATWSNAIVQANAAGNGVRHAAEAIGALYGYFDQLVEWRRRHPGPDMLSDLVQAQVDGRPLDLEEILGFCFVLIAGGNDTASGLLGGSAVALTTFRSQRRHLIEGRVELSGAVDELLRFTSPVQGLSRTTTRRVERPGCSIPAGSKVHLLYGSANRDPREFGPTADQLDLGRSFRRSVTFGGGPHHCIGAAAARLQGRVVMEEMLHLMPDFEADGDGGRLAPGPFVRRYASLPITVGRPGGS